MQQLSARAEWGRYWTLPIAAALGYATSVIHIYGLSPYIVPVSEGFGWDRSTVTAGLTIATLIQALFGIPIGMLVDRIRATPARRDRGGAVLRCLCHHSALAADGSTWQWYGLWVVMACATLPVQATIWTAAVATRFEASRGMAFAVTLCGASVAQALFPWLGAILIESHGWQTAMGIQAAIWVAIAWPLIFLFFRGARDEKVVQVAAPRVLDGSGFLEGLKSTVYLRLLLASALFTFVALALVVNFSAIQTDRGMDPTAAGALAFWIGIFAIVGRLSTGVLIDRLRANLVGAAVFGLPILACLSFLFSAPKPPSFPPR